MDDFWHLTVPQEGGGLMWIHTTVYSSARWLRMQALPAGVFLENPVHRTGGLNLGPAIAERTLRNHTELLIAALPRLCCFPWPFRRAPCNDTFVCLYWLLHRYWWWRWWLRPCPTLKDLHLMAWDAAVPGCAPGQCLSWGELPVGCPLLWIWNHPPPSADSQSVSPTSRSSTGYYACLLSNKRSTFITDTCTHTHRYRGRYLVSMYVSSGGFSQQIVQDC